MSVSLPYSAAAFADLMRISQAPFYLPSSQETSGQASGIIIAKDLGPSLWRADITTVPMLADFALEVQTLLEGLDGAVGTFYLANYLRRYPKVSGPFNDSSVVIHTLNSDTVSLSLSGLPANYVVTIGDGLAFDYGSPTNRAYHRSMQTITADGSGVTAEFQVYPAIRAGATTGLSVLMSEPTALMSIIPGSFNPDANDTNDTYFSQFQFSAQQAIL